MSKFTFLLIVANFNFLLITLNSVKYLSNSPAKSSPLSLSNFKLTISVVASSSIENLIFLKFKIISATSWEIPSIVENSCGIPSNLIDVTAAPGNEVKRVLLRAFPIVTA